MNIQTSKDQYLNMYEDKNFDPEEMEQTMLET